MPGREVERMREYTRSREAVQPTSTPGLPDLGPRLSPDEARIAMLERHARRDRRTIRALQYRIAELESKGDAP